MALCLSDVILGLVVLSLILYYYLTRNFDFWEKRNVPGPEPIPLFGNFKDVDLGRIHYSDQCKVIYDAYPDEPAIGIFIRGTPVLMLKDPEMIRDVMIKSFSSFADRGVKIHIDIDPLSQHLVYLEPKRWKIWRKRLSPLFTSGKLKDMFYLVSECATNFGLLLQKLGKETYFYVTFRSIAK